MSDAQTKVPDSEWMKAGNLQVHKLSTRNWQDAETNKPKDRF